MRIKRGLCKAGYRFTWNHIEYKQDKLYINGQFIDEPYLEKYKKEINGRQLTGDFTLEELTKESWCHPGLFL